MGSSVPVLPACSGHCAGRHTTMQWLEGYRAVDDDGKRFQMEQLEEQIGYSTNSIQNSYTKAQIAAGLEVAVIALFVTVFWKAEDVISNMLIAGVMMNAASIVVLRQVTGHRPYIWFEEVSDYAVRVARHSGPLAESYFLQKRNRANYNRVVLLRNRRYAFTATWFLAVPGFILGMMSIAWVATLAALVFVSVLWVALRWFLGLDITPQIPRPAEENTANQEVA